MSLFPREVRIFFLATTVCVFGFAAAVQYTELCDLHAVTLNGQKLTRINDELGLVTGKPIFEQPIDSLADALVSRPGIRKVNIDYAPLNAISITTNDLTRVCYALDAQTGFLYGLDASGRSLPIDKDREAWEDPMLMGFRVNRLYTYPSDPRVSLVVPQLIAFKEQHQESYRLIEGIDFSHADYVTVSFVGFPPKVRVPVDKFSARLSEFVLFLEQYDATPYGAATFNLCQDDMIIRLSNPEEIKRIDSTQSAERKEARMLAQAETEARKAHHQALDASMSHLKPAPTAKKKKNTAAKTSKSVTSKPAGKVTPGNKAVKPSTKGKTPVKKSTQSKKGTGNGR